MAGPQPLSQLICDFCGHLWRLHMDVAASTHDEGPIDYKHCAFLLLTDGKSTLGPTGPEPSASPAVFSGRKYTSSTSTGANTPGVVGPPGRDGQDGQDGRGIRSAHVTVEQDGRRLLSFVMTDGTVLPVVGAL